VREQRPGPQFLASSRHITGGGYDLESLEWADGVMTGRSLAVAGEPYEVYLTEPDGWTLQGLECDGGLPLAVERGNGWAKGGCTPKSGGALAWRARFRPGLPPPAPRLPLQ